MLKQLFALGSETIGEYLLSEPHLTGRLQR